MFLGRETPENHSQLPKKANKCSVGVAALNMHGGIDMSAPSLYRESTDSLIVVATQSSTCTCKVVTSNLLALEWSEV